MAVFIPEDKITEIRNSADIVDVVSEAVLLNKAGKNFKGLCPFHAEKTPSFTVSPEKQIFYCFGCSAGGNVFSFLMKHQGLSFPEAAKALARRYGIDLPLKGMSPEQKRRVSEKERLLAANRAALDFFRDRLHNDASGETARAYLKQRGVPPEIIERFVLGYAPAGWDHLARYFSSRKIPSALAAKSGLIVPRRNRSGFYDRFRNRIIFPIFDTSMQVIGFGGRVIDDAEPKYLNSPETPVYNKSRSLYGIHSARGRCREKGTVYIVEGYFDLIALHQHGIENAVATLGTALTQEHVRILKGCARNMVLVYDSDEAGIKAALRSIEVFMKEEMDARIMVLPSGYDPDAFLHEFGYDSFMEIAAGADSLVPFLIDSAVKKHGLSIEGKIRVVRDLAPALAAVSDSMARQLYVKELSERVGVDEAAVLEKIRQMPAGRRSGAGVTGFSPRNMGPGAGPVSHAENFREKTPQSKWHRVERQIVSMMLQFPEIIQEILRRKLIDLFEDAAMKSVAQQLLIGDDRTENPVSDIISRTEDPEIKRLIAELSIGEELWNRESCLNVIRRFESSRRKSEQSLIEQIKRAEQSNDFETVRRLLEKKQKEAVSHEKQKMTLLK